MVASARSTLAPCNECARHNCAAHGVLFVENALPSRSSMVAVTAAQLRYRRATALDTRACHDLMWTSVVDLGARHGSLLQGTADEWWSSGESLHQLLARLAARVRRGEDAYWTAYSRQRPFHNRFHI